MSYLGSFLLSATGIAYLFAWALVFFVLMARSVELDRFASLIVFLFVLIFFGFRDESSGTDTANYLRYFRDVSTGGDDPAMEPMFYVVTKALSLVGNEIFYLIALAVLPIAFIYSATRLVKMRFSSVILLSFVSFLPGLDLLTNGLRQGLGLSLAFFFWVFFWCLGRVSKLPMLTLFFFHKSLYIYSVFGLLPRFLNLRAVFALTYFSLAVSTAFFALWTFVDAGSFLDKFSAYLDFSVTGTSLSMGEKAGVYLGSDQNILQGVYRYYFLVIAVLPLMIGVVVYRNGNGLKESDRFEAVVFMLAALMLVPYAFSWSSPFAYRFMYLGYIPSVFLSVNIVKRLGRPVAAYVYMGFLLASAVLVYGSGGYSSFSLIF